MLTAAEREQFVLDHARRRVGEGALAGDGDGGRVGSVDGRAVLTSPTCGDRIEVRVALADGRVAAIGWDHRGCTVSAAAASVLAGIAPGRDGAELAAARRAWDDVLADRRTDADDGADRGADAGAAAQGSGDADDLESLDDVAAFRGLGRLPLRAGCATLAWRALDAALAAASPDAAPVAQEPERTAPDPFQR